MKKLYCKPVLKKISGITLVFKLLTKVSTKYSCRQCSGCHGCR